MSFALSSIVRTRQKKTFFSLFIFILLFFSFSSVVLASEEENIDSFDVSPINRWTISDTGITDVISSGMLNLTDTGDGSDDRYIATRDLRDLDGIIELRFKIRHSGSDSTDFRDRFYFAIESPVTDNAELAYYGYNFRAGGFSTVNQLALEDITNTGRPLSVASDERVYDDIWYIYRIDYDVLKSTARFRLYFDNRSKVFDYYVFDIHANRAELFIQSTLKFHIEFRSFTSGTKNELLVDYIKAPFKEREWTNTDVPSGFISNAWYGASAADNIDDISTWGLVVPYLDSISGRITGDCEDSTALAAGEVMDIYLRIYTVDYDDGDLTLAVLIRLRMEEQIAPLLGFGVGCEVDLDGIRRDNFPLIAIDDGDIPVVDYSFSISEDRSRIIGNVIFTSDSINAPEYYHEGMFSVELSDVSADYSSEFFIYHSYEFDFDGDTEFYGYVRNVKIYERDALSDIVMEWISPLVPGMIEEAKAGTDIFVMIFRWLGEMITGAFESIIGVLSGVLLLALSLVALAVDELIPFLQGIGEDVIDYLMSVAGAVLEAIFDALVLLIDAIADVVFAFWNAITGDWDLLALVDELLAYLIELIDWTLTTFLDIVQLADDLSWIILTVWWIWALPIQWARAGGNPLAGLGNFIEVYFYDAMPWSMFGFHLYIPQGIVFTLWMILLLPADFVLFTALGL